MAETKKASKAKRTKPRKPSASSKSKASKAAKGSSGSNGASASGSSVKETVVNGAHGAANGIAPVAQKAKLPLLATGAALAGAAAVIATKAGGHQRKVLGVKVPKRSKVHLPSVHVPKGQGVKADVRKAADAVTDAAAQADELGQRISKVASSVKTVSETANDAAKKA